MSGIGESRGGEISDCQEMGWGEGSGERLLNGYREFFWGDEKTLNLGRGGDCTTL